MEDWKIVVVLQTTFTCIYMNVWIFILIKMSLKYVTEVKLISIKHCLSYMIRWLSERLQNFQCVVILQSCTNPSILERQFTGENTCILASMNIRKYTRDKHFLSIIRNKYVIITAKWCCDVIITYLLRGLFAGLVCFFVIWYGRFCHIIF